MIGMSDGLNSARTPESIGLSVWMKAGIFDGASIFWAASRSFVGECVGSIVGVMVDMLVTDTLRTGGDNEGRTSFSVFGSPILKPSLAL